MRWVAMFGVVFCHAGDPFNFSSAAGTDPDFIWWGSIWGTLARVAVPLFVMITGALLLPVPTDNLGGFYKKRILRILWPFLIWSMIYSLFPFLVHCVAGTPEATKAVMDTAFPYETFMNDGAGAPTTLEGCLGLCAASFISLHHLTCHFWYGFMLIGLYLYLPIFSAWVSKADLRQKYIFLCIWGLTLLLPYAREFLAPLTPLSAIFGECDWNSFGLFYYFAGFNGYLLLGHILRERFENARPKLGATLAWAVPAIIGGFFISFIGFLWVRVVGSRDTPEVYLALSNKNALCDFLCHYSRQSAETVSHFLSGPMIELFWQYCSLAVAAASAGIFAIIQQISVPAGKFARFLATLAPFGFGFYLMHYFYIGISFLIAVKIGVPVWGQTPVCALIAFVLTYCTIWPLYRILPCKKILFG